MNFCTVHMEVSNIFQSLSAAKVEEVFGHFWTLRFKGLHCLQLKTASMIWIAVVPTQCAVCMKGKFLMENSSTDPTEALAW